MEQRHQSTLLAISQPAISRKALLFLFISVFFELIECRNPDSSDFIRSRTVQPRCAGGRRTARFECPLILISSIGRQTK